VVDLINPGASGTDIVDWLRMHRPDAVARTAMLSSAPPSIADRIREAHPALRLIRKPFELTDILEFVESTRGREHAPIAATTQFSRRSITAGAKSGLLVRRDGAQLELVHRFGYGPQVETWFPLPASEPYPLCNCVTDGSARWIASPVAAAEHYPHLLPLWRENQSCALASVPVVRNGVVIGAAGWTFREPQAFDESEQRAFTAIAAEAASALESTGPAGA
jgi:GAF domain-containing protein